MITESMKNDVKKESEHSVLQEDRMWDQALQAIDEYLNHKPQVVELLE